MTTIAFTFARMNPPTIGHQLLVDTLKDVERVPAHDRFIYLSPTQDAKNNPLSHERRVELATKAFYDYSVIISEMKLKDVFACMQHIYQMGYSDAICVVGSDRYDELAKRLPMYNGTFYKFNSIKVVKPEVDRDKSADGIQGMSASKLREAAKLNDYASFENGLPLKLRPLAPAIFEEVREACL